MKCPSCGRAGAFIVVDVECCNMLCEHFSRNHLTSRLTPRELEVFDRHFPPTGLSECEATAEEFAIIQQIYDHPKTLAEVREEIHQQHLANAQLRDVSRQLGFIR